MVRLMNAWSVNTLSYRIKHAILTGDMHRCYTVAVDRVGVGAMAKQQTSGVGRAQRYRVMKRRSTWKECYNDSFGPHF